MCIKSLNVKIKSLNFFVTFVYSNKNDQTKQNKTVAKINIKSLIYLLGGGTAKHVNFMQPMLVL